MPGVLDALEDVLHDAWCAHGSLSLWQIHCGAGAYAGVLEAMRPYTRCHPDAWPPDCIVTRLATISLFEDPDLPFHHVVLRDRDGVVRAGMVTLRGER